MLDRFSLTELYEMMGSECAGQHGPKKENPSVQNMDVEDGLMVLAIQSQYMLASLWGFKRIAARYKEQLDQMRFKKIKTDASVIPPPECAP